MLSFSTPKSSNSSLLAFWCFCVLYVVCCTSTGLILHFSSHFLRTGLVMLLCTLRDQFPRLLGCFPIPTVNQSSAGWSPEEGRGPGTLRRGLQVPPWPGQHMMSPLPGGHTAKCCLGHGCPRVATLVSLSTQLETEVQNSPNQMNKPHQGASP